MTQDIPYGYCHCGCGQKTNLADRTRPKHGHVKGEPFKFIIGHTMRGRKMPPDACERLGDRMRGKPKSAETRARMSAAQRGERGSNWAGGRIVREGRTLVYVGREHPMADTYGYVYEHRLIFAAAFHRPVSKGEHVHHVDLDPANNNLANLVVVTNSEHTRVHNLIRFQGVDPIRALDIVVGASA